MALDAGELKTKWGNYYKEGSLGVQDLKRQLMFSDKTQAYFPLQSTNDTQIRGVNMKLSSVTQPFYAKFSHLGTLEFKPHEWNLDRVKINVKMTPDDLASTAIDFLAPKGLYKKDAPIVSIIGDYLVQKHKEDNEVEIIFKGVRKDVSPENQAARVAGLTIDSRTGIRHKIRLFNQAGLFTDLASMFTLGAVPTNPVLFVEYMETFYWAIPEKYRMYIKEFFMSTTLKNRYISGMRTKYNLYNTLATDLLVIIDTDCKIVGLPSHDGSDMIWCTIEGNNRGKNKNPENKGIFKVEDFDTYDVRLSTDFYQGEDFYTPQLIWSNGRDLTIPA